MNRVTDVHLELRIIAYIMHSVLAANLDLLHIAATTERWSR
jgi:hypothetical protein